MTKIGTIINISNFESITCVFAFIEMNMRKSVDTIQTEQSN